MPDPSLPTGEGVVEALADALRWLKSAERTVHELRAKLLEKHSEEAIDATLEWLARNGMLSEARAVESQIRSRSVGRKSEGNAKIRERLERRGADEQVVQQALDQAPDETDRMQDALAAKFKGNCGSDRSKAGRFLVSRGFDEDSIEGALDRFFGDG